MLAVNDNAKDDYDDPWSNAVLKAHATGREEAVSAIFEKGMTIRDIAYSGQATREKWKARGALNIWRAAYAAALPRNARDRKWRYRLDGHDPGASRRG